MAKNGSTPKPQNRNPEITKGPNGYSSSSSYQPTNIHDIRWFNRWKRNSGQGSQKISSISRRNSESNSQKETSRSDYGIYSGYTGGSYSSELDTSNNFITSEQNLSQVVVTNINLGGKSLQYNSGTQSPQCVTSLRCRWEMGVSTECSFTLYHHIDPYDNSGSSLSTDLYEIPILLQNAYNSQSVAYSFNYGYNWVTESGNQGLMTPLYGLTVTDCTFKMYQSGIEYTIKGVSFGAVNTLLQGKFKYNWAKDKDGYVGGDIGSKVTSAKLVTRICDVVEKIFELNGYKTQWLKGRPQQYSTVLGADYADEAASILNEGSDSETMMAFAKELLTRLQLRESSNIYYSNYNIQFRDHAQDPTILVYPTCKYVYENDKWVQYPACNYGGNTYIWNGNPNMDTSGFASNSIISTTLNFELLPSIFVDSTNITDNLGNEITQGAFLNGNYTQSPDAAFALATNSFYNNASGLPVQGSITIPGTTKEFLPNEVINIEIYVANQLFFTSGQYMVLTKTDTISGGRFETVLELIRIVPLQISTGSTTNNKAVYVNKYESRIEIE